jgi:hypothetical protein
MIAVLASAALPSDLFWVAVAAGGIGSATLLPILGGQWQAFELRATSGQFSTLVAFYPVGFGETARTILKANAVRMVVAFPIVFGCAAATLHFLGIGPAGPGLCLRGLGLLICAQPLAILAKFSRGTNDSTSTRVILVAGAATPFVLLGVGLLLWGPWQMAVLGMALALGSSSALLLAYGSLYGSTRFDALRSTPPE